MTMLPVFIQFNKLSSNLTQGEPVVLDATNIETFTRAGLKTEGDGTKIAFKTSTSQFVIPDRHAAIYSNNLYVSQSFDEVLNMINAAISLRIMQLRQ